MKYFSLYADTVGNCWSRMSIGSVCSLAFVVSGTVSWLLSKRRLKRILSKCVHHSVLQSGKKARVYAQLIIFKEYPVLSVIIQDNPEKKRREPKEKEGDAEKAAPSSNILIFILYSTIGSTSFQARGSPHSSYPMNIIVKLVLLIRSILLKLNRNQRRLRLLSPWKTLVK